MTQELIYSVTDFVAVCNQVMEISFEGNVSIVGELANFKVSKNKWIYFDLKDNTSILRFFGTIYQVPSPLEDGMLILVKGNPVLHPKYGFSINVASIQLYGEGTIKKSANLLEQKLQKQGIFEEKRKRKITQYPKNVGIIGSKESAGYSDFKKIANERWSGVNFKLISVLVQGEKSPNQIATAIEHFNQTMPELDALVVIRGGGSAEDLLAYNNEKVVLAIAASRIPVLAAIGHETDLSLVEKAADMRASTPSNAAQLLLPDKRAEINKLRLIQKNISGVIAQSLVNAKREINLNIKNLNMSLELIINNAQKNISDLSQRLALLNPEAVLKRGFAIARQQDKVVGKLASVDVNSDLQLEFMDGFITVNNYKFKRGK